MTASRAFTTAGWRRGETQRASCCRGREYCRSCGSWKKRGGGGLSLRLVPHVGEKLGSFVQILLKISDATTKDNLPVEDQRRRRTISERTRAEMS